MESLAEQWIATVVLGSPVATAMGVELVEAEVDAVTLRLPQADHLTTLPGVTHGGTVATLIDIAGAASSATGVKDDEGATGGATTHLSVTYLAPATTELTAVAEVVHRTRSGSETTVRVLDDAGGLVALGQVTSRVFH